MLSMTGTMDTVLARRSPEGFGHANDDDTRRLAVNGTAVVIDSVLTILETIRHFRLVTTVVEILTAGRMIVGVGKHRRQRSRTRGNSTFQCPKAHAKDADKRPNRRLQSDIRNIRNIRKPSFLCSAVIPRASPAVAVVALPATRRRRPSAREKRYKDGQWVYRLYNILAIYIISYTSSTISYPAPCLLCCPFGIPSHQYYKSIYLSSFLSFFTEKHNISYLRYSVTYIFHLNCNKLSINTVSTCIRNIMFVCKKAEKRRGIYFYIVLMKGVFSYMRRCMRVNELEYIYGRCYGSGTFSGYAT